MRIALIILSILAMIFIGSVTWSLMSQEGWSLKTRSGVQNSDNLTIETWKNQIKTEAKIEELNALVKELAVKNGITTTNTAGTTTVKKEENVVKVSGKLLALLMPTITLTLKDNDGIFGLYTFDGRIAYSTYSDESGSITIIPLSTSYDDILKNARAFAGNPYTVNETKTFSFRSFYLNPPKSDTMVRLVVEMEAQSVALEIPKTKFNTIKDLLLGKKPSTVTPK